MRPLFKPNQWLRHFVPISQNQGRITGNDFSAKAVLERALGNGVTREEIAEVVTHMAIYAGWPAAMTAAHVACDLYEEIAARP
jgi:alkylhydroperoxidase/carboxymuconolactone decarboxylase family protein YurZ